jgi:hypothetical protein
MEQKIGYAPQQFGKRWVLLVDPPIRVNIRNGRISQPIEIGIAYMKIYSFIPSDPIII